jgi:urea carboxylase-associated protein 1
MSMTISVAEVVMDALAGLGTIILDEIVPPRAPWSHPIRKGETLRIIDLEGNQSADFLMYALQDDTERYSAQDTIAAQRNVYLRTGSMLYSNEGNPMALITGTDVAHHDTIGGACSCESNTLRYGFHTQSQHACVENFLSANLRHGRGKRDMVSNINWFMNVPVEADGTLGIVDGISAPGLHVDLLAQMDLCAVVSNCPQINNPCNAFNPTALRMVIAGRP